MRSAAKLTIAGIRMLTPAWPWTNIVRSPILLD